VFRLGAIWCSVLDLVPKSQMGGVHMVEGVEEDVKAWVDAYCPPCQGGLDVVWAFGFRVQTLCRI
jgi:hypothetical protein